MQVGRYKQLEAEWAEKEALLVESKTTLLARQAPEP